LGNDMIEGLVGDPKRVERRDAFSRAFWGPLELYAEEQAVAEEEKAKASDEKNDADPAPRRSFHRRLERKFNRAVEDGSFVNVCVQVAMAVALHFTLAYRNVRRALEAEDARRAEAKKEAARHADERLRETPPASPA
jgi:hypothetical protein